MRLSLLAALALASLPLAAQQSTGSSAPVTFDADINIVNVPVTVTNKDGKFVGDLRQDDFAVYENGVRCEIKYFTPALKDESKPPLRIGFLADLSNTARLYYKTYKDSIGDLAWQLIPDTDDHENRGFLIGYHTEYDLLVDYTKRPWEIQERLEKLKHGGGSSMLDALYFSITQKMRSDPYQGSGEPRKVVVVIGDGHDNASKHTVEEVIYQAQKELVTVYAISTVGWSYHEPEESNLYRMAKATGGRVGTPLKGVHDDISGYLSKPQDAGNYKREVGTGDYARAQLEAIYGAILDVAGDIQMQYLIGYVPPQPFDDQDFRTIDVKVNILADMGIRHRTGYFPPKVEIPPSE